jgi:hypothetical protein
MNELELLEDLFTEVAGLHVAIAGRLIVGDLVTVGDQLRSQERGKLPVLVLEPASVMFPKDNAPSKASNAFAVLVKRVPGYEEEKDSYYQAYSWARQIAIRLAQVARPQPRIHIRINWKFEPVDPMFVDGVVGYRVTFEADCGGELCIEDSQWFDLSENYLQTESGQWILTEDGNPIEIES